MGISLNAQYQGLEMTEFDSYIVNFNEDIESDNYIGSPYLNDKWSPFQVELNGKSIMYRKARYNLVRNHIEVMIDGKRRYIKEGFVNSFQRLESEEEESIYLYKLDVNIKNRESEDLLRLTKMENCQVLTEYAAKIRKASTENPHLSGMESKGKLIVTRKHHIIFDNKPTRIKKTKDLYKLFKGEQKKIKSTLRELDIDIKTHQGILTLLRATGSCLKQSPH